MSRTWSGLSIRDYKQHKGLKKENLRDHMTNTELVLNMLAEVAATDIAQVRQPQGFAESAQTAQEGAQTAKAARLQLEKSTGRKVVSKLNAKQLGTGHGNEGGSRCLSHSSHQTKRVQLMSSKKNLPTIRSSAAEYLTFIAASGQGGVEAVYADEELCG